MSSMEQNVQKYLQQYSKSHPVIHIVRDSQSIQEYLSISDEARFGNILRAAEEVMRSCCNFEFYNAPSQLPVLPDGDFHPRPTRPGTNSQSMGSLPPFLALKNVEQHFLKLISLIFPGSASYHMDPVLCGIPVHLRSWTYAASVPIFTLNRTPDLETLTTGVDALELVLDSRSEILRLPKYKQHPNGLASAVARLRSRSDSLPIIVHVDHAMFPPTETLDAYFETVRRSLDLCPEYLTFDLGRRCMERNGEQVLRDITRRRTQTRIIGHFAFRDQKITWQDPSLVQVYKQAQDLGCDLVRFTRNCSTYESLDDVFEIQEFKRQIERLPGRKLPVIAYSNTNRGQVTACFNKTLTAVTTPEVTKDHDEYNWDSNGHPIMTAQSATKALYGCFVFNQMQFYIIGASAGYSLSPAMHNAAYEALGLPHSYDIHQIPDLKTIHAILKDGHFGGASISQPFKVDIMHSLNQVSQHAQAIGAVNTILPVRRLNDDGSIPGVLGLLEERGVAGQVNKLYGENTDWIGITACIGQGLSPANSVSPSTTGLIVGAGGMARAAVYALIHMGVRTIYIYNRTKSNAQLLAEHFRAQHQSGLAALAQRELPEFCLLDSVGDPWPISRHSYPTIVVSCIPTHAVGDSPAPYFTLPQQWMGSKTGGVVLELGYKTLNTPLLQQVRAASKSNWVAMDGLDLLPEQGFAQFELFTGRRAPRRLMREKVLECFMDRMSKDDEARESVMRRLQNLKKW
ncbi:quinate repressor [Phyllosticta capitalensis]